MNIINWSIYFCILGLRRMIYLVFQQRLQGRPHFLGWSKEGELNVLSIYILHLFSLKSSCLTRDNWRSILIAGAKSVCFHQVTPLGNMMILCEILQSKWLQGKRHVERLKTFCLHYIYITNYTTQERASRKPVRAC